MLIEDSVFSVLFDVFGSEGLTPGAEDPAKVKVTSNFFFGHGMDKKILKIH
jgi:hypothetical protein